jgi:competence protein ComEC
MFQTSRQSRLK